MKKERLRMVLPGLLLLVALLVSLPGCNLPFSSTPAPDEPGLVNTLAAQTIMAQMTQIAMLATATPPPPSATLPPTATPPQPTATLAPSSTLPPTATLIPSFTPLPSESPTPVDTPIPCNAASFVADVTVPDGTTLEPAAAFKKTWRIKNVGSCTWTKAYSFVFVTGELMGGKTVNLAGDVKPGEKVDISVDMVAPSNTGTYKGNWMLRDDSGFGIGAGSANKPFWVLIKVGTPTSGVIFNFAKSACSASWSTGAGKLPCPGTGVEPSGFVIPLDKADLEHRSEDEPILWTNPQVIANGFITGIYPKIQIEKGDEFIAEVGCLAESPNCDIVFQVNYRIDGKALKSLGSWREVSDSNTTVIEIDLSALEGKEVEFILTVSTNGEYDDDAAFWLMPHIYRPKAK